MDGVTDRPSYRDAMTHLKKQEWKNENEVQKDKLIEKEGKIEKE